MAKNEIKDFEKALTDDERVELFLSKNWKKVLAAAVLVIIVIAGVFAFNNYKEEQLRSSTNALAAAKAEELSALLEKDSAVPGAGIARLRLAQHLLNEKKYADAAAQFAAFSQDQNAPAELRARARISGAACLESAGDKEKALSIYLTISNAAAMSAAVHNEAVYHAGRLYIEQGKQSDAAAILKLVVQTKAPAAVNAGYTEMMAMEWQNHCKNLLDSIGK